MFMHKKDPCEFAATTIDCFVKISLLQFKSLRILEAQFNNSSKNT